MRARRRDLNDAIVSEALKKAGFSVLDLASVGSVPDKLVHRKLPDGTSWVCWVEIKSPTGKLRPSQTVFEDIFEGRGEFYVARDPEETVKQLFERYQAAIRPEHQR